MSLKKTVIMITIILQPLGRKHFSDISLLQSLVQRSIAQIVAKLFPIVMMITVNMLTIYQSQPCQHFKPFSPYRVHYTLKAYLTKPVQSFLDVTPGDL